MQSPYAALEVAVPSAPRGVPSLPDDMSGGSVARQAVGVGLGFMAAGMTAAAGVAADRLSRGRRTAVALDSSVADTRFHMTPDVEMVVTTTDGVELHVEIDEPRGERTDDEADLGPRPTIVFSHGYCLSLLCWFFQRRALRDAGYRVVLWDQRGHGRSGMGDKESVSIDQLGDDLYRVIQETVPEGPIILVGHSMGGMSTMSLGLEYEQFVRERVVGVAFVATSPGDLSTVSYGLGRIGGGIVRRLTPLTSTALAARQNLVEAGIRQGRDLVDFLVDFGSFGSPVPMSVAKLTTDMIFGTRMEVIAALFPLFDEHDKRDALASFDGIEALVFSGTADRLTPVSHSEGIVRCLPGAEQVVVRDAGHVIMLEHPDLLNEHLLDLVARSRRSAAGVGSPPAASITRTPKVPRVVSDVSSRRAVDRARGRDA